MAILGAGPIGVELGQAFARLGCKVTLIEAGPAFLGLEEPEAGAALRPHLEADGITVMVGDPCVAVEKGPAGQSSAVVRLKSGAIVAADRLLIATGRRPNHEAWQSAGLAQTERGWLKVDRRRSKRSLACSARATSPGSADSLTSPTTTGGPWRSGCGGSTRGPTTQPCLE